MEGHNVLGNQPYEDRRPQDQNLDKTETPTRPKPCATINAMSTCYRRPPSRLLRHSAIHLVLCKGIYTLTYFHMAKLPDIKYGSQVVVIKFKF